MTIPDNLPQIVFSGGGLRCFWQGGFLARLGRSVDLDPQRVTGVSGGAMAGAAWIAGRGDALLDIMCDTFEDRDTNVDLFAADDEGITPHQRMYCDVVERVMDEGAQDAVARGPAFQIQIAHPPDTGWPTMTGTALAAAYEAELHVIGSPHFNWAEKMGLTAHLVDANEAARDRKLIDLVNAAAVIPPVFEPPLWEDRRVVDGGMADQAPMPEPDEGGTLVLLTRQYAKLPEVEGRYYVWPSEDTPADKIDFTDPQKLRETWDLGIQDAEAYLSGS